ncbi:MAG: UvrB/UvrC motif-containing protein, partial [Ruminococcus sp.]|nr:UvrB/UvrC motif-containing protein [Ruminococcus sp.]
MNDFSEKLEFEKAAKMRDRIAALNRVNEKQKVIYAKVEEQDVFALIRSG